MTVGTFYEASLLNFKSKKSKKDISATLKARLKNLYGSTILLTTDATKLVVSDGMLEASFSFLFLNYVT